MVITVTDLLTYSFSLWYTTKYYLQFQPKEIAKNLELGNNTYEIWKLDCLATCGKAKHKLKVASYEFRYTSYELKSTS